MKRSTALLFVGLVVATLPGPAGAASPSEVIADCNVHGKLTRNYPAAELRTALATMPANVKEYTNCYDVIQRALLGGLGTHTLSNGSQGGGGSFLPTPLIVVLVILVLAAGGFGVAAMRRREDDGPPEAG